MYDVYEAARHRRKTEAGMRLLVLVLAGVLVAAKGAKLDHDPRFLASSVRIHRLYHAVDELKHKIEEAAKIDPFGFIKEMHARLDQVEGRPIASV